MPIKAPAASAPSSIETKLDEIILHLQRMDKRDRLRTYGGFVRSLIAIIPIVLIIWSTWYFIAHGDEFMKMIADQAASSAAEYTKDQSQGFLDQMMKQYSTPK